MVSTRSASSSPVKKQISAPKTQAKSTASGTASKPTTAPLRLVIAPRHISHEARIITLLNASDSKPKRYLFSPQHGLFELTQTTVSKQDPRSTLLHAPNLSDSKPNPPAGAVAHGFVNREAEYMTATPYDMCFALLQLVLHSNKNNLFQSIDDMLDAAPEQLGDLSYVIQRSRTLAEEAMESICDTVDAGEEKMFRYSEEKTLQLIMSKARRACANGLPASLEERFVTRVLEAPVLSVRREESTISIIKSNSETLEAPSRTETPTPSESFESQSSIASTAPSLVFSEASITTTATTAALTPDDPNSAEPDIVRELQRLRTAFRFIATAYLPFELSSKMLGLLKLPTAGVDFDPLDKHLAHITALKAQAAASTDMSSFSRKRGSLEDEEETEARAEKKRKLEEEEKRKKAGISRGVKDLAKVDVKGMKKMSSFFAPKTAKGNG